MRNFEDKKQWTVSALMYLGLGAVVMQFRGAMLPNFQAEFGVSESLLGLVSPAGTIGFTVIALTTGMVAGRVDIRKYIQIGALLTAVTTFFIGLAPFYSLFLAAIVLRGMAGGMPGGLTRPILSHLYPDSKGRIFNIHEAVWAFGAACGPLVANLVLRFADWRMGYYVLGLAFVPIFLFMFTTSDFPAEIEEEPLTWDQFSEIISHPVILAVGAALFLNVGVEGGFFTWLPYYLSQTLPQSVANFALTGFIGAYVPGRLLNSYLSEKFSYTTLILAAAVIIILLLGVTFFLVGGYGQIATIVAIGFFISTVFPNLFSLAAKTYPQHSGPINGLVMTFDPLGISVMPVLMGIIADSFGIEISMRFLILPMIGVVLTVAILRLKVSKKLDVSS
ncbi:MFS transporter [Candidatus Bipolaricaulota bacterium]|nr:MFS transporter [Candidatus Bipolaricaulota bacterium]